MKKTIPILLLVLLTASITACLHLHYATKYQIVASKYYPTESLLQKLNHKGANIKTETALLHNYANCNIRQTLAIKTKVPIIRILQHIERLDLQRTNANTIESFILHRSQRNHTNPFTYETLNIQRLAQSNPETILQEIQGYQAPHPNSIIRNYPISISKITTWINNAKTIQPIITYPSFNPKKTCYP